MASRVGELSRSSGGQAPVSAATRRDNGSQGGARMVQPADSGELSELGWHVVDARNGRSGRPWAKLFRQLNKLLDDIYLTCELDCNLGRVQTMVEYLEVSVGDFTELYAQLESVVSPSGQKVAWEVRTCRRASSNRSPRVGAGSFGAGARHHRSPFASAVAAAATTPSTSSAASSQGPSPARPGSWAAAAAASAAVAGSGGGVTWQGQGHGHGQAVRAMSSAGAAVGSSGGGAAQGSGGVVAGSGSASSMGGAHVLAPARNSSGGGGGGFPRNNRSSSNGSNPWKGKVNWSELFTGPHPQQHQHHPQHGQQHPGAQRADRAASAGGTLPCQHLIGSAGGRVGSGGGDSGLMRSSSGGGDEFRRGSAPPPPRLKTHPVAMAAGSGRASISGEGSSSSPTGGMTPLDSLYHKMMTSPSRKLSPSEVRRASEERQARAEKARQAMVEEKLARLAAANQSRQTVKSIKEERAGAIAARVDSKIARSAELRQAHLAERVQKAVEETKKVAEVAFINQMLEQDKKLALQEKLEEGESRRRQALEALQQRGKGAAAAVEEAQERRKLLEAERREQLVDRQRRKMAAQAKLEEERRAAAAAREAASRAQRAAAAQAAEARQRQRDVLSVRIEERLREAAARRAQHLELIKERAALNKDLYERRTLDGLVASPRSPQSRFTRPPSPEVTSSGAGGNLLAPPPPVGARPATPPGGRPATSGGGGGGACSGTSLTLPSSPSALHHPDPASSSGPGPSPPPAAGVGAGVGVVAAVAAASCGSPLRSTDRSITLSSDPKRRLKGMRRRVCKTLARMEAARPEYSEPPHLQALLDSPEGRQLVEAWAQLVQGALEETAAAAAEAAAAAAAARSGSGRRKSGHSAAEAAAAAATAAASESAATAGAAVSDGGAVGGGARGSSGGSGGGGAVGVAAGSRSVGGAALPAVVTAGGGRGGGGGGAGAGGGGAPSPKTSAAACVKHLLQRVHTDLGGRSKGIAVHAARPSGLLAALAELLTAPQAAATSHPPQTSVQLMELLALLATSCRQNAAWLLARCDAGSLSGLVRCGMRALDRYNGLAADEVWEEPPEARYLAALMQTLACLCRTPFAEQPSLHAQQEELVAHVVACGLIHRSTELFSLFDQPAANDTAPIPGYVLQCLALLEAITGGPCRRPTDSALTAQKRWLPAATNGAAIALSFQETSMAGLPSLLTAVLLRAAPSCTPAEARPERLPPNFVEAAACVMRVLNNIARLDLVAAQGSLGASDLRVVCFHLVGFLLSYCTNQWPTGRTVEPAIRAALSAAAATGGGGAAAAPTTPAATAAAAAMARSSSGGGAAGATAAASGSGGGGGAAAAGARGSPASGLVVAPPPPTVPPPAATGLVQLLNEVLLLIGYYGLLQPANQDVLLWGKSPTILQRLAEVPFPYFVEQQLYQVLMPTLVAVCYGSERACATLSQHMDLYLLHDYVKTVLRLPDRTWSGKTSAPAADVGAAPTEGRRPEGQQPGGQQHEVDRQSGAPPASASATPSPAAPATAATDDAAAVAAVAAAPPPSGMPFSPRRMLLHDLPISTGTPHGGTACGGGTCPGESSGASASGAAGATAAATSLSEDWALPPPTAERYSLPQRFPPELLPQVLVFLERQMPGAAEQSTESALASAVAAAAAAGRLTPAPPPPVISQTPLAVVMGESGGRSNSNNRSSSSSSKKVEKKAAKRAAAGLLAAPAGSHPRRGVEASSAAAAPEAVFEEPGAGEAPAQGEELSGEVDADEIAMVGRTAEGRAGVEEAPASALAEAEALVASCPVPPTTSKCAGYSPAHSASNSAVDSASLGAGAVGSSSGRPGSSPGAAMSYSQHFRRYLDAGDVPVPFAAGGSMGVRRHRLLEAAAAAAVTTVVPEAGGAGGGVGGGGSVDGNNCARSYVSELSFGGYLTPSIYGDSRDDDPRSPGEDDRLILDELDLEQYDQQRLDEQQYLDEQDVLLLDVPLEEGEGGWRRWRTPAAAQSTFVAAAEAEAGSEEAGNWRISRLTRGHRGEAQGSSADMGAGLWSAQQALGRGRLRSRAGTGTGSGTDVTRQPSESEATGPAGLVLDAWWRQMGYRSGGEVASGSESSAMAEIEKE